MAAVAFTSQTNTVLGKLDSGLKVVSTVLTTATADTGILQVTVKPLTRIIAFFPVFTTYAANCTGWTTVAGTNSNQLGITPGADCAGACVKILSIGV